MEHTRKRVAQKRSHKSGPKGSMISATQQSLEVAGLPQNTEAAVAPVGVADRGAPETLTQDDRIALMHRAQKNPVWYLREILGVDPWPKQQEILESIRDNKRTAVKSCHASGKSWVAAHAALWYLFSHPYSIVATTAPTFRQVKQILWQEIASAHARAKFPLGGQLLQTDLKIAPKWYAFGFSTDDPDSAQGLHAPHILIVIDEACGVPAEIWEALEGALSSDESRLLSIGNPTDPYGEFAKEFRQPSTSKFRISAFDVPNVVEGRTVIPGLATVDWVEDKKRRWGESSPIYQARVLGEFPTTGDDNLIPLSWVERAQSRWLELMRKGKDKKAPDGSPYVPPSTKFAKKLGLDVARFGTNESALYARDGRRAWLTEKFYKLDTMETAGRAFKQIKAMKAERANVDSMGVGGGVFDRLKELKAPVEEAVASAKPEDVDQFANSRAEWFWKLREEFEADEIDLDPADDEIAAQLSSIRYKIDSKGRILIESKDDMKKRKMPSPDRADALAIASAECAGYSTDLKIGTAGVRTSPWRFQ